MWMETARSCHTSCPILLRQPLANLSNHIDCVGQVVRKDLAVSLPKVISIALLTADAW
jgi:hypothetical protein